MPRTRNSRTRTCKDLSTGKLQKNIGFPINKSTSKIVKKTVVSSPVKDKENTSKCKNNKENAIKLSDVGKKRTKENDENCCSPVKSPRKVLGGGKPPLADVTNSPTKSDHDDIPKIVEAPKRKLILNELQVDSSYTKLCQVLHNSIPKQLFSREKELKVLNDFVHSSLLESKPGSLYICGAPGTGKTACLTKVLEEVKDQLKVKSIFLNCMSLRYSQSIFSRLAIMLDGSGKSYSNNEGLKYLEKKLTSAGQRILLVLDEIDQLESKEQDVLYKLFELPFLPKSRLALIGIANSLDFTDRILPRLQTRTSYKPTLLQFQPYKKDDICAIIQGRIKETHGDIIDQMAIQFCARKVSAMTGDARKALDIMRRAVEVAEVQCKKSPTKDKNIGKVTIGHVASVCSEVYGARLAPSSNIKFVFPLQQKIIICLVVACLKQSKIKEITVSKLYQSYCRVSTSRHLTPLSQQEFNGTCDLLDSQGVISVKKGKDMQNNKIGLRMQESEIEHSLQDKSLMLSILSDTLPL